MNKTLTARKFFSWGSIALATSLLVSLVTPTAQGATYSLPNAPTNVTSYIGAKGVVVKWTPGADVEPGVTGYVVSAGAGSCPIFVPIRNNSVVTMPVVEGQPAGTPVVQIIPFKRQEWKSVADKYDLYDPSMLNALTLVEDNYKKNTWESKKYE